ncbi:MAG: hypothetical protein ACRC8S_05450 [Fimbriiglobus sp.]
MVSQRGLDHFTPTPTSSGLGKGGDTVMSSFSGGGKLGGSGRGVGRAAGATGFGAGLGAGAGAGRRMIGARGKLPSGSKPQGSGVEQPVGVHPAPDFEGVADIHMTIAALMISPTPRYAFMLSLDDKNHFTTEFTEITEKNREEYFFKCFLSDLRVLSGEYCFHTFSG